ncbi:helix-turn-helix transcriptional regulator [Polyangium aurulentum]|uniref:helix-turn-helix transcriptional regulator n=1 Tax=Polyangium aurulentum TaxID=2567896 RepID=UPI0010AE0DF3|nr:winged helix-turn-helix domain-containing protein [Polyangium aurulentum]UQA61327.1 winged helix-turn-helix domain-containing protein [Polyangium aurulentum]
MTKEARNKFRISESAAQASRRAARAAEPAESATAGWTFLTNHAHVLLCLVEDAEVRLRDVATRVGITERAVQRIVSDLEEAGYVTRSRVGRRNSYEVHGEGSLRHPIVAHRDIKALLDLVPRPRRPRATR